MYCLIVFFKVINGIHALGRKGKEKKFDGPLIGSQESSE